MIAQSALVRAVSTFFFFFVGNNETRFSIYLSIIIFENKNCFQRWQNVRLFSRGRRRAWGTFEKNYAFLLSSEHSKNVHNILRKRFKWVRTIFSVFFIWNLNGFSGTPEPVVRGCIWEKEVFVRFEWFLVTAKN